MIVMLSFVQNVVMAKSENVCRELVYFFWMAGLESADHVNNCEVLLEINFGNWHWQPGIQ